MRWRDESWTTTLYEVDFISEASFWILSQPDNQVDGGSFAKVREILAGLNGNPLSPERKVSRTQSDKTRSDGGTPSIIAAVGTGRGCQVGLVPSEDLTTKLNDLRMTNLQKDKIDETLDEIVSKNDDRLKRSTPN